MPRAIGLTTIFASAWLAACTTSPSAAPTRTVTPSASASTSALPTPRPTPTAVAVTIGDHLEPIDIPDVQFNAHGAAYGSPGYVLVGHTCTGTCDSSIAAAWSSPDGRHWSVAAIADSGNAEVDEVAWSGSAFVAVGHRWAAREGVNALVVTSLVWRSADGRAWDRVGALDLGPCFEGCPSAGNLVAARSDYLFLGSANRFDIGGVRALWSSDAKQWKLVEPADVGYPAGTHPRVASAIAFGDGVMAAWTTSDGASSVWATEDFETWRQLGSIDAAPKLATTMATDGSSIVVADDVCPGEGCATTQAWTAIGDGPFVAIAEPFPLSGPHAAFAAGLFIIAGLDDQGMRMYTSPDGRAWVRRSTVLAKPGCGVRWLAGGPDAVILVDECGEASITHA